MVCDEHQWWLQTEIHLGSCCNGCTSQFWGMEEEKHLLSAAGEEPGLSEPCRKSSSLTHKASKTRKTTNIGMASENPAPGMLQDVRQCRDQPPESAGAEISRISATGLICTTQYWAKKLTEELLQEWKAALPHQHGVWEYFSSICANAIFCCATPQPSPLSVHQVPLV